MSASGCMLLLGCLLLTLVLAIVEGLRMPLLTSPDEVMPMQDPDKPRTHILFRLLPVYPLLAFLALQALLFVAKSGQKERSQEEDS